MVVSLLVALGTGAVAAGLFWEFSSAALALVIVLLTAGMIGATIWLVRGGRAGMHNWLPFALAIAAAIFVGAFQHDSLYAGRDDGVYVAASAELARHGELSTNELSVATFPGFVKEEDGRFAPQYLPGYIVAGGLAYSWGGYAAVAWSGAFFLFFTLLAIYLIGERLGGRFSGYASMAFFATCYVTIWFSRRTFSESLMLFLFWFAVAWLLVLRDRHPRAALLALAPTFILVLVRPEGAIFVGSMALAVLMAISGPKYLRGFWTKLRPQAKAAIVVSVLLSLALPSVFMLAQGTWYSEFLREVGPAFLNRIGLVLGIVDSPGALTFQEYTPQFVTSMLLAYGMIPFAVLAACSFYFVERRSNRIILLTAAVPSFVYLLDPLISPDQPFFMRRFWPVFVPLLMVLAASTLGTMRNAKQTRSSFFGALTVAVVLLSMNVALAQPILFFSDSEGLAEGLSTLAEKLEDTRADRIVFSPGFEAGYASILHGIYGLPTYYIPTTSPFFSGKAPPDSPLSASNAISLLSLETSSVVTVSYVSPARASAGIPVSPYFLNEELEYVDSTSITFQSLVNSCRILNHITQEGTRNRIDVDFVRSACSDTPPGETEAIKREFHIYLVTGLSYLRFAERNSQFELSHLREWEFKNGSARCIGRDGGCMIQIVDEITRPSAPRDFVITAAGEGSHEVRAFSDDQEILLREHVTLTGAPSVHDLGEVPPNARTIRVARGMSILEMELRER